LLWRKSCFLAPVDQSYELAKAEQGTPHRQSSFDRRFHIPGVNRFYSASIFEGKPKPNGRQVTYFAKLNFLANHISDLPWSILQLEVDSVLLLLILNEVRVVKQKNNNTDLCQYLCVSTLQP
jgi:hypothetical protein